MRNSTSHFTIISVAWCTSNFIKISPIIKAIGKFNRSIEAKIINTCRTGVSPVRDSFTKGAEDETQG